jgi:hypothetical protein
MKLLQKNNLPKMNYNTKELNALAKLATANQLIAEAMQVLNKRVEKSGTQPLLKKKMTPQKALANRMNKLIKVA